ncbi:MAG: formate dehydrogenase subunit alpha [Planctomycetes bacterium]|nr:formate dehydrogenase subunit alpha [Planctomycetota bacterium]
MSAVPSTPNLVVDGRRVVLREKETILELARRSGLEIPTLCHVPGLAPEGGCRLCMVELGNGQLAAACHTQAQNGMELRTTSDELRSLRRELLRWIAEAHPGSTSAASASAFAQLLAAHGLGGGLAGALGGNGCAAREGAVQEHPYLRFEASKCITCRRCVQVCDGVQGAEVYGVLGRGGATQLAIGPRDAWSSSTCVSCGACVEACPTGAIADRDRPHGAHASRADDGTHRTRSTCGYCGVGCQVDITTAAGRVQHIDAARDADVNRGHLCAKGRYAHGWQRSSERLTTPLLRDGDGFRAISWDEALDFAARRLGELRDAHGGRALGLMTSSRSTNEAAYLLQRLFRSELGSNHVDCCARVCHSSTALALSLATGTGAASACYDDLERARCLVVAGANPTEAHPVVGARIEQAARRGVPLIVIDPRQISLVDHAELHLSPRPGTNVALFGALAKLLLEEGLVDRAYLAERCEGLAELERFAADLDLEEALRTCELEEATVRAAARRIGGGPTLFVTGLGLSEVAQGVDGVLMLCTLAMLTGSIGRVGAGMLPLRGQNNVQGAADMGSMPDRVTGYQPLDDEAMRARARELWGAEPPLEAGFTIPRMLEAARRGELRGLWIQGEDLAQSDPCEQEVLEALRSLELLIVQEMFLTDTAREAHLVLPAAGVLEQDGTFTNGERRIQRVRAAVSPPTGARPDWEVALEVGKRLGSSWSYASPAAVMEEIARFAPSLFGGVRYERLERNGLHWPCPTLDHTGTPRVHQGGFLRGKGKLHAIPYLENAEHDVPGFPLTLITGRVLQHYNVGTMTRRTPQQVLVARDELELCAEDARALGIADGDPVEIESRWGRTQAPARVSERVREGQLFLSFHFPETHANRVVGPVADPRSHCPQYKAVAVRLRKLPRAEVASPR